jgi:simple sugar transport system ATP-binding protein
MVHAGTLSGGNQQKAVVAREFSRELSVLVLDQPTRGLDVGSIEFIHKQVITKRDHGAAILLVSAELDEVMELSDRVGVMYRGELVALVDGPTAEREEIGLLMATGRRDQAALAEATTSMTAGRRPAQGGAQSPPTGDGNQPT